MSSGLTENKNGKKTIHTNTTSPEIRITEDKLNIILTYFKNDISLKYKFLSSLPYPVTFFFTWIATDFKPFFGISAESFKLIVLLIFVSSIIYVLLQMFKYINIKNRISISFQKECFKNNDFIVLYENNTIANKLKNKLKKNKI